MPATESQKRASAKWRANNRAKAIENVQKWRAENPERATAISRASGLKWYYKNREAQLEKNREKRRLAAEARMREYEERDAVATPIPNKSDECAMCGGVPMMGQSCILCSICEYNEEPTTDSEAESEPEIPTPTPAPAPSPFVHRLFR
jgi:hypothetical protein